MVHQDLQEHRSKMVPWMRPLQWGETKKDLRKLGTCWDEIPMVFYKIAMAAPGSNEVAQG